MGRANRQVLFLMAFIADAWFLGGLNAHAQEKKDFSHIFHKEQGAEECATCHDLAGAAPVLNTEGCDECHSEGVPPWRLAAKAKREKIVFPHTVHATKADCVACHEKTVTEKQKSTDVMVPRATCVACHTDKKVVVREHNCKACHGRDQKTVKPDDHRNDWLRRHGSASEFRDETEHGKACTLCHQSTACTQCHRTTRPRNHTGLWRARTHGYAAEFDRDACKTCHETGSCVLCHQTSPPLNHRGNWKTLHGLAATSLPNQQCGVCHKPAFCAACHHGK